MFLVRANHDRTTVCTASAVNALAHVKRLRDDGHVPRITDLNGRTLDVAALERRIRDNGQRH